MTASAKTQAFVTCYKLQVTCLLQAFVKNYHFGFVCVDEIRDLHLRIYLYELY